MPFALLKQRALITACWANPKNLKPTQCLGQFGLKFRQ
jgi:hypothetical protein